MHSLRVLYFEAGSGSGGSSASLYRLIKVLRRNGIIPIVAARQNGPNIDKIRALGVRTVLLPTFFERMPQGGPIGKVVVAMRLLAEVIFLWPLCLKERVNLIHLNTGFASCLSGIFLAKVLRTPCVSHIRGNEVCYTRGLTRWAARGVDEYLCVSSAVKEIYHFETFKKWDAVRTIYDGLDAAEFKLDPSVRSAQRQSLHLGESDCAVGMVARFVEGKGHEQFLLAARDIVLTNQSASFFLIGANGNGNASGYEKRIRHLAEELSLGSRVTFLEWQSDVSPLVAAMDFIVLPSLGEGLPLALAEAMALGKAVVATKVGGIPELVRDGKEGLLVPPADAPALAEAMKALIVDSKRRQQMAETGRNRISEQFSMEKVAGEVLETYERLMAPEPARRRNAGIRHLRSSLSKGVSAVAWTGATLTSRGRQAKDQFAVLMYHRVVKEKNPYFPGVGEKVFEQQLAFLKRYFNIVPLGEVVTALLEGKTLPQRTVCLTFDDGVRDTFTNAFPVLLRLGLPATVFLTTGAMDGQRAIWTDLVASVVAGYEQPSLSVSGNGILRRFQTDTQENKVQTISSLKGWLKGMPNEERLRVLRELEKAAPPSLIRKNDFMMTWDQVKAMGKAGIEFGAHTVSHPILSRMEKDDLEKEIVLSKDRIEAVTGQRISLFAYPNGEEGDFDQRAIDLLKMNGFVAAFSTIYGINKGMEDPFVLKRIPAFEQPLASFGCRLAGYK